MKDKCVYKCRHMMQVMLVQRQKKNQQKNMLCSYNYESIMIVKETFQDSSDVKTLHSATDFLQRNFLIETLKVELNR